MIEGSSSVPSSQQLDIQDVQRTKPTPEQRQNSDQVQGRGASQVREAGQAERAGKDQVTVSDLGMDQMEEIKESLNEALRPINIALNFEKNENIEDLVVKILNRDTEEVIRQIPPEAMLNMAQRIDEMTGLLVNTWR